MTTPLKYALAAFDVLRGVIFGVLICYGILRLSLADPEDLIFRYAGY